MSTVIPLRQPAYEPLHHPGRCMTPGHEERPARLYAGGWRCGDCLPLPFTSGILGQAA